MLKRGADKVGEASWHDKIAENRILFLFPQPHPRQVHVHRESLGVVLEEVREEDGQSEETWVGEVTISPLFP